MTILNSLTQITGGPPAPGFGERKPRTPAEVVESNDDTWYRTGLDLLDDLLVGPLRRKFRLGDATPKERRGLLSQIVVGGREALWAISRPLILGRSTLARWFSGMKSAAMPRFYAGVMALLGPGDLPPIDRSTLKAQVVVQLTKLEKFRREILDAVVRLTTQSGRPNGTIGSRAAQWGSAAWMVAMNVQAGHMKAVGHKEELWHLSPADHCVDCPGLAALGWVSIGTLPDIGVATKCKNGCRCWKSWR